MRRLLLVRHASTDAVRAAAFGAGLAGLDFPLGAAFLAGALFFDTAHLDWPPGHGRDRSPAFGFRWGDTPKKVGRLASGGGSVKEAAMS